MTKTRKIEALPIKTFWLDMTVKHDKSRKTHGGWGMAVSFQITHPNLCQRSRTPPFPQTNGMEQIFKA
jgi:hypothetical protein